MEKLNKVSYVKQAEDVINNLSRDNNGKLFLTTTQIRNVHSLINELYDMARLDISDKLSEDIQSHVQYIKMKIVYIAGRSKSAKEFKSVKEFVNKSKLIEYLDSIGNSRDALLLVCHYSEALVAYHKYIS